VQLKAAAARSLAHDELWEVLGLSPSRRRGELYTRTRALLPSDAARYWDARPDAIAEGIALDGGRDRMLHWIGRAVTALQGDARVTRLLACETLEEQRAVVDGDWNTRRWRVLQSIVLSDLVLERVVHARGSSPATAIRAELDHLLRDVPVADNFYLHYMFRRTYPSPSQCPAWLAVAHHDVLRTRVDRLACHTIDLAAFLASPAAGTFDAFCLSNVFDWMSDAELDRVATAIVRAARPGARLCYWTNTLNDARALPPAIRVDRERAAAITRRRRAPGYSGGVVATIGGA
jgi:S-adenosylmethionine-diacylglycerol 3-amino-3-carboxypropyl transferase